MSLTDISRSFCRSRYSYFGFCFAFLSCCITMLGCGGGDSPNKSNDKPTESSQSQPEGSSGELESHFQARNHKNPMTGNEVRSSTDNPAEASLFSATPGRLPNARADQNPFRSAEFNPAKALSELPSTPTVGVKPGSDFAVAPVSFEEEAPRKRILPIKDLNQMSDAALLKEDAGSWIKRKTEQAVSFSRNLEFQNELTVWNDIAKAFEEKKLNLPWVETTVRLNQKFAKAKTAWTQDQVAAWKSFQSSESELMKLRSRANQLRSQNQAETTDYNQLVGAIYEKLEFQLDQLKKMGLIKSFQSANVFEQAALASIARKNYSNALGLAKQSLVIRQTEFGYHPDTIKSLKLCANICKESGRENEATDFYFNAANLCRKVWGTDHLETAEIADQFGLFILNHHSKKPNPTAEDFKFSKVWLEEAVRIRSLKTDRNNMTYATSLRNLGRLQTVLANIKGANSGLELQAADGSYQAVYKILLNNKIDDKSLNEFLLEYSAIKAQLGQNAQAEQMLGQIVTNIKKNRYQANLSASAAEIYFRWALTCLRQKQMSQLQVGKERLLSAKKLAPMDQRSNNAAFIKKTDAALARVAQLEAGN